MTAFTEHLFVVIVASVQQVANQQAARVDTDGGGEQTFTMSLSPTGNPPATHYWCSWTMTPGEKSAFQNFMDALVLSDRAWLHDASTVTPDQVLTLHGLQVLRSTFP